MTTERFAQAIEDLQDFLVIEALDSPGSTASPRPSFVEGGPLEQGSGELPAPVVLAYRYDLATVRCSALAASVDERSGEGSDKAQAPIFPGLSEW